jgi:DHA1 family bicyclomycin/chloramphenicol resistance-like MFS transporter
VSHSALCCFIGVSFIHSLVCLAGFETIVTFTILQALTMGSFGLAASNFNAIAMQKMGAIAGSAASLQGITSTIGGAMVGSLIGHQWQGHVTFLPAGTCCCGVAAMMFVLIAEKGRLFRNPPPEVQPV